jgi:hypothetical protein
VGAALADDAVKHVDDTISVDPSFGFHRQRLPGELTNHLEQLDRTAVSGHVELEIERPHMIRALGTEPVARHRGFPATPALTPLRRHPQPLLTPQPLGPLAIDLPALLDQMLMSLEITPARPLA